VIDNGWRLPLRLEPRDDLLGVHTQLDILERHATPHRFGLLRDIDHAASAFADSFQNLVAPDGWLTASSGASARSSLMVGRAASTSVPSAVRSLVRGEQGSKTLAQRFVAAAFAVKPSTAFGSRFYEGKGEQGFFVRGG
jgi:hypothetical protein